MLIYINPIKNLQENFKARFNDLFHVEMLELIISSFDIEMESGNLDTFLKEEFIEINFDLEAKSLHLKSLHLKELDITGWTEKLAKSSKLSSCVEPILLAFQSSYIEEYGFSQAHYLLSKNFEYRTWWFVISLINLQSNICDLLNANQTRQCKN